MVMDHLIVLDLFVTLNDVHLDLSEKTLRLCKYTPYVSSRNLRIRLPLQDMEVSITMTKSSIFFISFVSSGSISGIFP